MRRCLSLLSLSLLASFACCFGLRSPEGLGDHDVLEIFAAPAFSLPALEGESSPYFSKQVVARAQGREEILRFRSDGSAAHLFYSNGGSLQRIKAYRLGEHEQQSLAYEALYDAAGRRVLQASSYAADGLLETKFERCPDGVERRSYYEQGKLRRLVELTGDGRQRSEVFNSDGTPKKSELIAAPTATQDLFYWDAARKQLRLRVHLSGSELSHWEYFARDGSLAHKARTLSDGSLEFSYFEKGTLRRQQTWRLIGEDWERCYYALSDSLLFAEGGKIVEHHVTLRSSGQLLSHERFNAKSGLREMRREFDLEGRVERIEEFDATGKSKQVYISPASSPRPRGFVPDRMRAYPGEEEKNDSIYQFEGLPFQHSALQRQSFSFFRTPQVK